MLWKLMATAPTYLESAVTLQLIGEGRRRLLDGGRCSSKLSLRLKIQSCVSPIDSCYLLSLLCQYGFLWETMSGCCPEKYSYTVLALKVFSANGHQLTLHNTVKLDLHLAGFYSWNKGLSMVSGERMMLNWSGFYPERERPKLNIPITAPAAVHLSQPLSSPSYIPLRCIYLSDHILKSLKNCNLAHCWQFLIAHCVQMLFYLNQLHGFTAWISDFGAVVFFLIMLSVHLCHMLPWIYAAVFY